MPAVKTEVPDDAALNAGAKALGRELVARGLRLAVAESCTGGWIAKTLTDVPGASDWFSAGFVTYSDEAKARMLGVSPETLGEYGAVSEPVVREMIAGARDVTGAAVAIAVSGIAGPDSDLTEKPVGLVHFAFSLGDRSFAEHSLFRGDREAVRRQAVAYAITVMLRALESEKS